MNYEDILNDLEDEVDLSKRETDFLSSYRRALCIPEYKSLAGGIAVRGISDIEKLPIIDGKFLIRDRPLHAIPEKDILRYCYTSGSTGDPKLIPYSRLDIENAVRAAARTYAFGGTKRYDTHHCGMSYGPLPSGLICHAAGEVFGLTIPADPKLGVDWHFEAIRRHRPQYMSCIPSFLPRLERACRDAKTEARGLGLERIFLVGEMFSDDFHDYFAESFGAKIVNKYASTEMAAMAVSCQEGRLHFWDDYFYVEVLDAETHEKCSAGDVGELVVTSLQREALPLVRYNTHDLVRALDGNCSCGSVTTTTSSIMGRGDDAFTIFGINVYPIKIEEAVTRVNGLSSIYTFTIRKKGHSDYIKIVAETTKKEGINEKRRIKDELMDSFLKSEPLFSEYFEQYRVYENPEIVILDPGQVSGTSWKIKKISDLRN